MLVKEPVLGGVFPTGIVRRNVKVEVEVKVLVILVSLVKCFGGERRGIRELRDVSTLRKVSDFDYFDYSDYFDI